MSQEALRAYFPIDKVLSGLFSIVQRLYGIEIAELKGFDSWHPDVRLFEIKENGQHVGRFFFDLYARANKRGGAWMDGARDRRRTAWPVAKTRWLTWCATSPGCAWQAGAADP